MELLGSHFLLNKNNDKQLPTAVCMLVVSCSTVCFILFPSLLSLYRTENIPQTSNRTPEDLLSDTWGSYITYVSSFIFIGLFWLIHHNTFEVQYTATSGIVTRGTVYSY